MSDRYELNDLLFQRTCVTPADHSLVCGTRIVLNKDHNTPKDPCVWQYEDGDSVKPKFDSVAAAIMFSWSLDSGQDEDCGDAQTGNGWHALFRSERAILHTDNLGFVSAWRTDAGFDIDEVWESIEKGARYMDDEWECENGSPTCSEDDPCVVCDGQG